MSHIRSGPAMLIAMLVLAVPAVAPAATGWKLIGWNDLGMHCTDGTDYSVFGILPPYNNVHAQLIDANGHLVTSPAGVTVTYEAVADPAGSINRSSIGKTNFWTWLPALFGVSLPPDTGLAGRKMPGAANAPQPMVWDTAHGWFAADGVPITPYDDGGAKNFYPMMRLVARDAAGVVLATTSVVLPVSDEMDCRSCHASGSVSAAAPAAGWVNDRDPLRDYKLNILRLHDERSKSSAVFASALAARGYRADGLYATATIGAKPILCDQCHSSNALPGLGISGIAPLTAAIHSRHANVTDPATGQTLNASTNRTACYRCHPGSVTRCLRGAMSAAATPDGSNSIQCESCHGSMSDVGRAGRQGWLEEPLCQSCHTGTATSNSGSLRYQSVFVSPGVGRTAADPTFASNANTPATGLSLYRFSTGHGKLQCEACHGATHAEYPTTHANDNIQSIALQGHSGPLVECTACHASDPSTVSGGPHGMHPVGQVWVSRHPDAAENSSAACATCHGTDFRGTELSRTLADRTLSAFGTKQFFRGSQIGCYTCHNGPRNDSQNPNSLPQVANASAATAAGTPVTIPITATDADHNALTLRVVSQPAHGLAGISGTSAVYSPDPGYAGPDSFTVAAWDGSIDSNLATVSVSVGSAATTWTLSVQRTGAGSGVVTSAPAGIDCGSSCSAAFANGTVVTLTALPSNVSSAFDGWTGGSCTGTGSCSVTMSQARSVVASFRTVAPPPLAFTLSVTFAGTGRGSISSVPSGINCTTTCSSLFAAGTRVRLHGHAGDGSVFDGWTGEGCSGTDDCTVTVDRARAVTATFSLLRRRASD